MQGPKRYRSIAAKVSIFTGLLVSWVVVVVIAVVQNQQVLGMGKAVTIGLAVVLVVGGIAKFSSRLLVRPLAVLEQGIRDLESGKLRTIRPERTGDEIEYLGYSFTRMVVALSAFRQAVTRSQEVLEKCIAELSRLRSASEAEF